MLNFIRVLEYVDNSYRYNYLVIIEYVMRLRLVG